MATLQIRLKSGEAKTLKFTYKENGVARDMTGATFAFVVKENKNDVAYTISKVDADFDKTDIVTGIVRVTLTRTNLDITPKLYVGEIRAYFSDSAIDLSQDIAMTIATPVYGI